MKTLTFTAVSALIATPALAHGGAHLHPHGVEPMVAGLAILSVALLIFALRR
ncbi:MAG: peptidase M23 [Pelagimonas sp.]|uniref:peptidase M23 n=1 Tax=Pelagimonas sp. TaxID=2073170 RepID=UPI003D6AB4E1